MYTPPTTTIDFGSVNNPDVKLGKFATPEEIAVKQASTIMYLLDEIDKLAEQTERNMEMLEGEVDPNLELDMLPEDDDDDPLRDGVEDETLNRLSDLVAKVVVSIGTPNMMLPYDMSETLSFDNRPNPKNFAANDLELLAPDEGAELDRD